MSTGWIGYADAVKPLGGDHRAVEALDRLTGGLPLAGTGVAGELVLSLFDAKGELAEQSRRLGTALRERLHGLGRCARTCPVPGRRSRASGRGRP